jgi:hypothetical protein
MPSGVYQHKKGKERANWKGDFPKCLICGKTLSARKYKYCGEHRAEENKGEKNPNWKGGKPKCEICGKVLCLRGYTRCRNHRITTEEGRENMRLALLKRLETGTWRNQFGGYKIDRNSLKKYGIDNKDRGSPAYHYWRIQVLKRDNFKCRIVNQDCEGKVIAHHILSWRDFPELRYQLNNGITLCQAHHPRRRTEEKRLIPFFMDLVPVSNEPISPEQN